MKFILLAFTFIASLTLGVDAFGGNGPLDCPKLLTDEKPPNATLTHEELFEALMGLESNVASLRHHASVQPNPKTPLVFEALVQVEQRLSEIFEQLAMAHGTPEHDLAMRSELRLKIDLLAKHLLSIETDWATPIDSETARTPTETSGPNTIRSVSTMADLRGDTPYTVPLETGGELSIIFTRKVLRELTDQRAVDLRVQAALLQAAQNGVTASAHGQRGIKIMKSHDKVTFVELKSIGGVAGAYRVYGCIESGVITLHFLGTDMRGPNDPQRDKIKNLCR